MYKKIDILMKSICQILDWSPISRLYSLWSCAIDWQWFVWKSLKSAPDGTKRFFSEVLLSLFLCVSVFLSVQEVQMYVKQQVAKYIIFFLLSFLSFSLSVSLSHTQIHTRPPPWQIGRRRRWWRIKNSDVEEAN